MDHEATVTPAPAASSRTLRLRHAGGEVREIEVFQATEDGVLYVRWPSGAGVYVVHVFRQIAARGYSHLFRTKMSRIPLDWQAEDPEGARQLWREMTGRKERAGWKREWDVRGRKYTYVKI